MVLGAMDGVGRGLRCQCVTGKEVADEVEGLIHIRQFFGGGECRVETKLRSHAECLGRGLWIGPARGARPRRESSCELAGISVAPMRHAVPADSAWIGGAGRTDRARGLDRPSLGALV